MHEDKEDEADEEDEEDEGDEEDEDDEEDKEDEEDEEEGIQGKSSIIVLSLSTHALAHPPFLSSSPLSATGVMVVALARRCQGGRGGGR